MRNITVAAIQMRCVPDPAENLRTAERLVRQAAGQGAQVVLLPELFAALALCCVGALGGVCAAACARRPE